MQRPVRVFFVMRMLVLVGASLAWGGCKLSTDASAVHSAGIANGDGQTGSVNTAFPLPLTVIVVDQYGFVMENIQVSWAVMSGDGTVSATDTKTGTDGTASVVFTAGATAGVSKITATISGLGTLTFTETAT
jgi:hypothetical protein